MTSTDGTNNVIVWAAGSDGRLRGYNGDTGAVVYAGGGANELMAGTRSFNTGIAARGRIYYATDNKVYAFTVPASSTPTPSPTATPTPTPTPTPTHTDSNPTTNTNPNANTNTNAYSGSNGLFTYGDHRHVCDQLHPAGGNLSDQCR